MQEKSLLSENGSFDWGQGQPLEKVINSEEDFEFLMKHPRLFRNAIAIIEPWNHVGYNPLGEHVRASLNVAYIAQTIAESKLIRRSFTCQFHPELLSDLRVVGFREPPSYSELKKDDGARLFARLLYEGMQE